MGKKTPPNKIEKTPTEVLKRELPSLLDKLGIGRELLESDVGSQRRLREIIDKLPDPLVSNLHDRVSTQLTSTQVGYRNFIQTTGISKSEEKLLACLIRGNTVVEHAEEVNISINTARTHMRRLLEKTDSKGQLDLIQKIHKLRGA